MQAIETKYIGPTNFRGGRIVARCEAERISVSYDHALGLVENHMAAAQALAKKLDWQGTWAGGALPNTYVWVCTTRSYEGTFTIKESK